MFEGPLPTNLSSSIPATDIGYDVFTYARLHHRLAWILPLLKCVSQPKIANKSIKKPYFDVQGHPRSVISVAIESQCTT